MVQKGQGKPCPLDVGRNIMAKQTITIWDDNPQRIAEMETHLRMALDEWKIDVDIHVNSERPLLARNGMIGAMPAFQIDDGDFWRLVVGKSVSVEEFNNFLYRMVHIEKILHI